MDFRIHLYSKYLNNNFALLNENLTYYRRHENSITIKFTKISKDWWIRRAEAHDYLRFFAEKNGIEFPLLCDVERIVTKAFGIEIENFGAPGYTASQRSIFIIEEDGSIGYIWIAENPGIEPNYSEIFDYFES